MRKLFFLMHVAAVLKVFAQLSSTALPVAQGTLTVMLKDQSGAVVPALGIHYIRVPALNSPKSGALASGDFRLSGSSLTGAAGNVQVPLPVGHYLVCIESGTTAFLDPCRWGTAEPVDIASGQATPAVITLVRGVQLDVSISDPKHLLPPDRSSVGGPPPVIVGVLFGRGAFLAANCVSAAGAMSCSMPIPVGVPFKLWLHNQTISLIGTDGAAVPENGIGASFQAMAGTNQQFSFIASGSKLSGTVVP